MYKTRVQRSTNSSHAFTRLELLACILGCGLVMAVILPGLANSTARSDRVLCVNNLRQIGVAYANFGLEHGDAPPWRVPFSQGGTAGHPLKNYLYAQFSAISNWLGSPKLLADPGDERRTLNPAQHWGTTPGGLWVPPHQNNAVSYFLGISGTHRSPRAVLSGDRNLSGGNLDSHCPGFFDVCVVIDVPLARWTNDVHGSFGNLLFFDGAVEQTDSARLREAFQNGTGSYDTNGVIRWTGLMMPPSY